MSNRTVLRNLSREINRIKGRNVAGMALAAALVKQRSMERTPVDHGNLKASHYIATGGTDSHPEAQVYVLPKDEYDGKVYLTAEYAVYVHEDLTARHPTGEAKFLENAVVASRDDLIKIIKSKIKV